MTPASFAAEADIKKKKEIFEMWGRTVSFFSLDLPYMSLVWNRKASKLTSTDTLAPRKPLARPQNPAAKRRRRPIEQDRAHPNTRIDTATSQTGWCGGILSMMYK